MRIPNKHQVIFIKQQGVKPSEWHQQHKTYDLSTHHLHYTLHSKPNWSALICNGSLYLCKIRNSQIFDDTQVRAKRPIISMVSCIDMDYKSAGQVRGVYWLESGSVFMFSDLCTVLLFV